MTPSTMLALATVDETSSAYGAGAMAGKIFLAILAIAVAIKIWNRLRK